MKKTIILIVTILLALLLCTEAMAVSIQKSIVSADAKWVVNIDMKKFPSTRLYELLMNDKSTVKIRKRTDKLFRKFKFDPFKDITSVTAYGTERDEEKTVVCLSGNFNKDHILSLLEEEADHKEISHGKYIF